MKSRRYRWAGHVARMEDRSAFKILTGIPTGKRPLGWHRRKNVRMDLKGIDINTRNLVDLPQDRDYWRVFVNAALNLRVPSVIELVLTIAH